jgi:hypothetical protein
LNTQTEYGAKSDGERPRPARRDAEAADDHPRYVDVVDGIDAG